MLRQSIRRVVSLIGLLVAGTGFSASIAQSDSFRATVASERVVPEGSPVYARIRAALPAGNYLLSAKSRAITVKAQVVRDRGESFLAFLTPVLKPGETLVFEGSPDPKPTAGVSIESEGRNLRISIEGAPFSRLVVDDGPKPYLYPLIGPSGLETTRAFPMRRVPGEDRDHPHQRSFWFTHGSVNGVDFWSEIPGHGSIRETSRPTVVSGSVVGLIRSTHDWLGPDGKKICEDDRLIRVYATKRVRILDYDVELSAGDAPATFGDTKEGTFGLRVASSMDASRKPGGKLTNAEGLVDASLWGKPSAWVDYVGPVAGKTIGAAIFDRPDGFRHPTTWHARPYGLFAANPFGWRDFGQKRSGAYTLKPGRPIAFHYRVYLHDGDTASAGLPQAYDAFAHPPKVELTIKPPK